MLKGSREIALAPMAKEPLERTSIQQGRLMLWLAAWMPDLGLELFEPDPNREQAPPAVLVDKRKVRIANRSAREAGVLFGSSLATAHSIAAELQYHTRSEDREEKRLRLLAELVHYRFSPRVCIQRPDALLLEIRGSLELLGGMDAITGRVQEFFKEQGHGIRLGVGHTSRTALTLAKTGTGPPPADDLSPEALRDWAMQALHEAALEHAGLHPGTVERLHNMGIFKIGALIGMPRNELGKRFQKELNQCLEQLTGEIPETPAFESPLQAFRSTTHLLEPVQTRNGLEHPMRHLIGELERWLHARCRGVVRIRWTFRPFSGEGSQVLTGFALPRNDSKTLCALSRMALETAELPPEIMSIELEALETGPVDATRNRDLFGNLQASLPDPSDLLDRLAARMGEHTVRWLHCNDDHRPEAAALSVSTAKHFRTARKEKPVVFAPGKRPLWLLDPPKSVTLRQFRLLSGPERIQGTWGDQQVNRDYFIALHESGSCCWLFQNSKGWFQHGYFS